MIWNKKLMQSKRKPSPILGALAAIAVLALLLVIYMVSKPVPMAGTKSITIDVIYEDQTGESYQISTETQFLKEALDEIPEITIGGSALCWILSMMYALIISWMVLTGLYF